jgi:beta-N-acetylhexosaminidase
MRESIGEVFLLGFRGSRVPDWLRDFAARFGLGGVILFDYDVKARAYDRNVHSLEQVRALCADLAALPSRPLVFVDQEGGKVRRLKERLGFAPLPSAQDFAALDEAERLRLARASFRELAALGIHYNLAPVVDLNLNPANPDIGAHGRSFSADPAIVRDNARLLDRAAREAGLGLCLKHYPGMGGATTNSHDERTDLSATLREDQLALFHELGAELAGEAILVSHGHVRQWDARHPVSMSARALGRLRERLPEVLLISDDLQMQGLQKTLTTAQALSLGLAAGLDLLLIGNNLLDQEPDCAHLAEGLAAACRADDALARRLSASRARVEDRKARFVRPPSSTRPDERRE